ncbi:GAF domain-containing protein [Streptomyces tsukubensis]|uniref:GAF domain-containing protein n=1 Tax=Streptomyces tsukubensis TaxID=83656 RepID=UPI00344FFAB9
MRPPSPPRRPLPGRPAPEPAGALHPTPRMRTTPAAAGRDQRLADLGLTRAVLPELDQFATVVGRAAGAAYAFVNFLGDREQFFAGLWRNPERDLPAISRTMPLTHGFCPALLARADRALVLTDVYASSRFRSNPVVDQLGIRSYVGAALLDPHTGLPLATVCFIDTTARDDATGDHLLRSIKTWRDDLTPRLLPTGSGPGTCTPSPGRDAGQGAR